MGYNSGFKGLKTVSFLLTSPKDLQVHGLGSRGICDFIVPLQRYSNRGSKESLSTVGECKHFEFALQRCLILVLRVLRSEIVLELTNMFNCNAYCNDFNGYDLT